MVVARWVKVEGKKAAIRDDGLLLLIEHGIECLSLCHAEGAGAGLFDISVLLWRDGVMLPNSSETSVEVFCNLWGMIR